MLNICQMQESTYNELTEEEDLYMVPAKSENVLYEQLRSIKTGHLNRKSVKYVFTQHIQMHASMKMMPLGV